MTVTIALAPALAERAGGKATHQVTAGTVGEALASLGAAFPEMQALLWRCNGEPNPFLVIFLNDQAVQPPNGLETRLHEGDEIVVAMALEGG